MKINSYLLHTSIYNLKKSIPKILKRTPKKHKLETAFKLQRILELKQQKNTQFTEKFMNSAIFKLTLLSLANIKNFASLSETEQNKLFVDSLIKIQKYCDKHCINIAEYIAYYNHYKKVYSEVNTL